MNVLTFDRVARHTADQPALQSADRASFDRAVKLAQDASIALAEPLALVTAQPSSSPPKYFQPSDCASRFIADNASRQWFNHPLTAGGGVLAAAATLWGVLFALPGTPLPDAGWACAAVAGASAAVAMIPPAGVAAARLLRSLNTWRTERSYVARRTYESKYRTQVAEFHANRVGSLTPAKLARMDAIVKGAKTPDERAILGRFASKFLQSVASDRSIMTGSAARLVDAWELTSKHPTELTSQIACALLEGNHDHLRHLLQKLDEPSRAEIAKAIEQHISAHAVETSAEHWALVRSLRIHQSAVA